MKWKMGALVLMSILIYSIAFCGCVDDKNNPLPLIVLAGVNGSGKTTLLEFIANFKSYFYLFDQNGYLVIQYKNKE